MKIVQIIDSLEVGGAERMAISYANALAKKVDFSGLIATRKEGELRHQISQNVSYLFLNKKKKIDFKAVFNLRSYIKHHKVEIIHAHSSSFFIAFLVKLTLPKIKIIWHDHYGTRIKETKRKNKVLIFVSLFFKSIFVVNLQLKEWSSRNLFCKNVFFIPNFVLETKVTPSVTVLKGIEGRRIVFLANLKKPKNHILILKVFDELKLDKTGWSLHLIGKDYEDSYSELLKRFIQFNSLENHIHLYGERNDIKNILSQSSIGVLASTAEGFPVTLLEYAIQELATISTNVGYCPEIIVDSHSGLLFDPTNEYEVKTQLKKITDSESLRKRLASNFKSFVIKNFSEDIVIEELINVYKK